MRKPTACAIAFGVCGAPACTRLAAACWTGSAVHGRDHEECNGGISKSFRRSFLRIITHSCKGVVESGRMMSVKIETPANHMTEDARWDYRVTIRFKNSTLATTANPDEESLIKQLWPDQNTYKREEQRRFEILLAHWDLPVTDIRPRRNKSSKTMY